MSAPQTRTGPHLHTKMNGGTVHNQKDHFMLLMRPYFHADLAIRTLLAGSSQPLQDASTLHDVKQHADGDFSNICETVPDEQNTEGGPRSTPPANADGGA